MAKAEAKKVYLLAPFRLLTRMAAKAIPERRKIPATPTPTTPENKLLQAVRITNSNKKNVNIFSGNSLKLHVKPATSQTICNISTQRLYLDTYFIKHG